MPAIKIFQIYYSQETRRQLDGGFIPLDNSTNERPDWREYWPIRRYLLNNRLELDTYYGFLSPKFREKTRLDSETVLRFLEVEPQGADVVTFSPFFDQMSFFLNLVEHGMAAHQTAAPTFRECMAMLVPQFQVEDTCHTSLNSVFCNYFVARSAFWLEWFELCERIFDLAERNDTPLGQALNAGTTHDWQSVPAKVFVIERMASVLLSTEPRWRVKNYNPMALPLSPARIAALGAELVGLDALKMAYTTHRHKQYKEAFLLLRERYRNSLI